MKKFLGVVVTMLALLLLYPGIALLSWGNRLVK